MKGGKLPALVVFVLVAALYLSGALEFLEFRLADSRFMVLERAATEDLVIVDIDSPSLRELQDWPWPRSYHALVLENLFEAGAARVAFDVDFSSTSSEGEDEAFEQALAAAEGTVVLAAFKQFARDVDGQYRVIHTAPLPRFRRHATLALINVRPGPDGLVRRMLIRDSWNGTSLPTLSALLAHREDASFGEFFIDFGIRTDAIPRVSYADVLEGRFDPALVAGKQVVVGTSAIELGDQVPVPVVRSMPGVLLQALAFQSLHQRALQPLPPGFVLFVALLLALIVTPWFAVWSWRRGLAVVVSTLAGSWLAALLAQAANPVLIDTTPWMLVTFFSYAMAMVGRIDRQAMRLMLQGTEIRHKEVMMRNVVENSFDSILTMTDHGIVETANSAAARMFGYPAAEMTGRHIGGLLPELNDALSAERLIDVAGVGKGPREFRGVRKNGRAFAAEAAVSEISVGERKLLTAIVRDVSQQKLQAQALQHQAVHDSLTGLPNRTLLHDRLRQAILLGEREGKPFALLLLDLDRFKEINDTLGHPIGDLLLQQIALRLKDQMRKSDTIARLGGDEFAVLLPPATNLHAALQLSRKIFDSLEDPFELSGLTLDVSISIGIAMFPEHGNKARQLLQRADVAMYTAKEDQSGHAIYDARKDHHSVRNLTLSGELRQAIEDRQMVVFYQPKVDLRSGRVCGVEALVRWDHPRLGFVPPDDFLAMAEQTGMIKPLTRLVLDIALRQAATWRRDGLDLTVAVNISARHLKDQDLPLIVEELIDTYDLPPDRVILEITESAIMVDPKKAMAAIMRLKALGVGLAIDDFGTGYSSLAYLKDLPADEMKIDKSFVIGMEEDTSNTMIVQSTIDLAHTLGLKVIAEGIETEAALEKLKAIDCDIGQGYFFGRPQSIADFSEWLATSRWAAARRVREKVPA